MEATDDDAITGLAPAQLSADASLVSTSAEPVAGEGLEVEEGKKRKKRLKKKVEKAGDETKTEPGPKRAKLPQAKSRREEFIRSIFGELTDLPRVVPSDVPNRVGVQSVVRETEREGEPIENAGDESLLTVAQPIQQYCLERELKIVKRDLNASIAVSENLSETSKSTKEDVRMMTKKNQTLEKEKANLQIELEKEKEERKRSDKEVMRLTSTLDRLRLT
ncbi:hypothetical protein Dimus_033441 [Dionaea muscipula]